MKDRLAPPQVLAVSSIVGAAGIASPWTWLHWLGALLIVCVSFTVKQSAFDCITISFVALGAAFSESTSGLVSHVVLGLVMLTIFVWCIQSLRWVHQTRRIMQADFDRFNGLMTENKDRLARSAKRGDIYDDRKNDELP
jgi:hypothetical protein